jgi:hypothetical protein
MRNILPYELHLRGPSGEIPRIILFSQTKGDWVPIQLNNLIKGVYVAPAAPHWYIHLVASALKRCDVEVPITQSDLGKDPVF